MPTKGQRTRQYIIRQALPLFSVKGYYHTSVNDILGATGLTKGGLYCHFKSKQEIWYDVYDQARMIWKKVVFRDMRGVADPLERMEKTVANVLLEYLGKDRFAGGCFFVNMLVELSGQSAEMSRHIRRGFVGFSKLFQAWLQEAEASRCLKPQLDHRQIANFIVIALNGAATLYMSSRDGAVLRQTNDQLRFFIRQLRR